ncbi:hypothetical protein C1637_21825 [Chryseobacterium lactis]|uniref:Uncharacterized protein n=1 Tax=Chryseobacterium lactis TaxID=1241981 RepID=A0A3G6RK09_CHRLC|nr:hypothetical protein [Chryseobacterium lactis]AZA84924.1 hypothetical protein EG342_24785 [Chryseobacterium lactis]AZB05312.1 hypothetical protein EG341_15665 [Chryseobacterium lactis]PNW11461.1 hypothetical protein C1637_21825 [Chryseobacterium lactis]
MFKPLSSLLLTVNFLWFNAQLSDKVKELAKPLDSISYAESSRIGVGGEESEIYNQFRQLAKVASNDELYYFAKNGSNALRVYSAEELWKRNDKRFFDIYTFYSQNPRIIKYTKGCLGDHKNIAEFMKDEVYFTKEIISFKNVLLAKKKSSDPIIKIQLQQIKDLGYSGITVKSITYAVKQMDEIDTKFQN